MIQFPLMDFKYHICSISYFFAMCYDNYTFSHFMRTFHQYLNNFVCNFFIQISCRFICKQYLRRTC